MKNTDNKQKQRKFLEEYINTLDIKGSALAAGYKKQTALANARNLFKSPGIIKELRALCDSKAAHLEVCKGYIIFGYLKILDWALSLDDNGKPNDAPVALRALDGLVKQLNSSVQQNEPHREDFEITAQSIANSIEGLDLSKI